MILQDTINVEIDTLHIKNKINTRYDLNCQLGDIVEIPWRDIRKTKHRKKKILIECDDCKDKFYRQIRDVKDNENLCRSCGKTGSRNPAFGKPIYPNALKGIKKWMEENENPAKRLEVRKKISEAKTGKQNKWGHHSIETKKKMSEIALEQFKSGKRKVSSGWGNIKIKKYKGIDYQSTYELKFLKHMEELKCLFMIDRGPIIEYKIDNIIHSYFSDYRIKDTDIVIEVKSTYVWKRHIKTNMIKKEYAEKLYDYILIMDNNFNQFDRKMKGVLNETI